MSLATVDLTEIKDLIGMLDRASKRPHAERARALDEVGGHVETEARGIVATFQTKSTGELEGAIYRRGTPVSQEIGADVKQAFFLETGSPTTGGPRPWLSGPAERGMVELLELVGKSGDIWD